MTPHTPHTPQPSQPTQPEHPTPPPPRTASERIKEAEAVRDELRTALKGAGIILPSLGLDPIGYTEQHPRPLVELGRCNLHTARMLTSALRKGTEQQ